MLKNLRLILGLLLPACCSGGPSCNLSDILCSCDKRHLSSEAESPTCEDDDGGDPATVEEKCSDDGGVFSNASSCPTEDRVGTCKLRVLGRDSYTRYYADPIASQAACEILGAIFIGIPGSSFDWIPD